MLARSHGEPGAEAPPAAPLISCHCDQPGTPHAMRLCAAWLVVEGQQHLGVRMAQMAGNLPESACWPGPDWPDLVADFTELVSHWRKAHLRAAQIEEAGPAALTQPRA
jgi:hypothetical protein